MFDLRLGVAGVVAAACLMTASIARADCKSDVECKGDRVCESGICVSPNASKAAPVEAAAEPAVVAPVVAPAPPPQPAPPPVVAETKPHADLVGVDFETKDSNESYVVTVGSERCSVPCTLRLPPGTTEMVITGSRHFRRPLTVEGAVREGSSMKVTLKHACVGCYVFGGIATGVGVAALIAAIAYGSAIPTCDPYRGTYFDLCTEDKKSLTVKTGVSAGIAALGLAVGLPSLFSGGSSKPQIDRVGGTAGGSRRALALAPFFSPTGGGAVLVTSF